MTQHNIQGKTVLIAGGAKVAAQQGGLTTAAAMAKLFPDTIAAVGRPQKKSRSEDLLSLLRNGSEPVACDQKSMAADKTKVRAAP